jgi:hypothetical protein
MSLPATMRLLQRGWLSSNNIVFLGREQTALVDSGYATHAPQRAFTRLDYLAADPAAIEDGMLVDRWLFLRQTWNG